MEFHLTKMTDWLVKSLSITAVDGCIILSFLVSTLLCPDRSNGGNQTTSTDMTFSSVAEELINGKNNGIRKSQYINIEPITSCSSNHYSHDYTVVMT